MLALAATSPTAESQFRFKGVGLWKHCNVMHLSMSVCVFGYRYVKIDMFAGLGGVRVKAKPSLRGSWSGYYLCSACETATEPGGIDHVWLRDHRSHLRCSQRRISCPTARLNEQELIENWNLVSPCADSSDELNADSTEAKHIRRQIILQKWTSWKSLWGDQQNKSLFFCAF